MKQDKCLFLTATIASILALYDINAYADSIACPTGKMLPAGYNRCVDCTARALTLYIPNNTNPNNFYCPGGVFVVNPEKSQGIKMCAAETVADSNHKRCEKRKVVSARALKVSEISMAKTQKLASGLSVDKLSINGATLDKFKATSPEFIEKAHKELKFSGTKKELETLIKNKGIDKLNGVEALKKLADGSAMCKAGTYLPANATSCSPCKDRYYCLGGTFLPMSKDQGLRTCFNSRPNASKTACEVYCGVGRYLPANGYSCQACKSGSYCPGGTYSQHTSKDQGLTENKKYTCAAGQYLPSSSATCKPCKDRYYCLGGSFYKLPKDQGLRSCKVGYKPDASRKKCVIDKSKVTALSCPAGQYLPINQNHCANCLENYYCEGGKWMPNASMNSGLVKCASGLVSAKGSKKASDCVKPMPDMVTCKEGYYLPAKSKECRECSGTNKYCPGVGPIRPDNTLDQGIKVCPANTSTNKTKSACQMTLTKDMLRYGIGKTASTELDEQCWIHEEISDYEKCMFGGKLKITAPASAVKAVLKKGKIKPAELKISSKISDLKK